MNRDSTFGLYLINRFSDDTRWLVRSIPRCRVVDETDTENEIFTLSNVVVEVVDLWRRCSSESILDKVVYSVKV